MPRARFVLAFLVVAYVGECAYIGYTPAKALLTTRVSLVTAAGGRDHPVTMGVGDSMPVEACIHDGQTGSTYRLVADCARIHPRIFRFENGAPDVVSVGRTGTIRARAPGHFRVGVHSMGRSDWIEGDVVERASLVLSARDTTLRVGDEILVGWAVVRDDGAEAPVAELEFASGTMESDAVATMQPLAWYHPGAARITARRPGHACYRLTGFNQTTWLSVVIVDSRGATRDIDGHPTAPERLGSCGRGAAAPAAATVAPGLPARLPRAAIDEPRVRSVATRFFAIETCLDSLGRRLGRLPSPGEEKGVVGRCLDARGADTSTAERWRPVNFRPRYPDFDLDLEQTEAGDRDGVSRSIGYTRNELTFRESAERGSRRVTGPGVHLQGDETQTVGAVLACAALHRARTGLVPPTLDSLLAFSKALWLALPPGEHDTGGCESQLFPRRARGSSGGANVLVHESRRFVVRYTPLGDDVSVTLRPVRYGETGVVSLRYDDGSGMHRTLADREATALDPELVRGATAWEQWRLAEPHQTVVAPPVP